MRRLVNRRVSTEQQQIGGYIMQLLSGGSVKHSSGLIMMTEKQRQYFTWGVRNIRLITASDGCFGVEFAVKGLIFQGRVRIYYNIGTDYFDIEFVRARKDECVKEITDVSFDELHNICHCSIERTDDPAVV